MIRLDAHFADKFIKDEGAISDKTLTDAVRAINEGSGAGSEFLGWTDVYRYYDADKIKASAKKIRSLCDTFVVIGIGGSYMGAKAAIEFLHTPFYNEKKKDTPDIFFAGNNISADYLTELLNLCESRSLAINVVSKSGTTTEPAVAFRLFLALLEKKYGKQGARERIFVTTDERRGTLKALADERGYETFVVPDDVGGRFSVLTSVGLLPIAVSGTDVDALIMSAAAGMKRFLSEDVCSNEAAIYAKKRHLLDESGYPIEILLNYEPALSGLGLWWQQLFGESHGKAGHGIFPVTLTFSQDLHSMGQYIQQGPRNNFETVLWINAPKNDLNLCAAESDADGLGYLEGKGIHYINSNAYRGAMQAHFDGGTPNLIIELDRRDEEHLGQLFSFFEASCAIGGYLLGVNPFDQPGVEFYKKNMFKLLGKPGYSK